MAERLQPGYSKAVVVDNKAGAGGQLAVQSMRGEPDDGASMLLTPMSMLGIYPFTYKRLSYNPATDLAPVSLGATFEFGLCVGPAVPESVKSVPAFMDWCKAHPDQASFGSPAAGSVPHFIGVLLGRASGVAMTHVPYRGTQPALLDVIGGRLAAVSGLIGDIGHGTGLLLPGGPGRSLEKRFGPLGAHRQVHRVHSGQLSGAIRVRRQLPCLSPHRTAWTSVRALGETLAVREDAEQAISEN